MNNQIKVVIFDLGGVVIDIDFQQVFDLWQHKAGKPLRLTAQSLATLDAYERHERDEIDFEGFYQGVNSHFNLGLSQADFEHGWNQIFVGPMPGVEFILSELSKQLPIYAFTNTNRTHEKAWRLRYPELVSHFQHIFTSTTLSQRKPEPRAFRSVLTGLQCQAGEALFLDDFQENVMAARQAGMFSDRVRSAADIMAALERYGISI